MDKRSPGGYGRTRRRMPSVLDLATTLLLVFFALLLVSVAFDNPYQCRFDWICLFLGVIEKAEAVKLLGSAIICLAAFSGVRLMASRRAEAMVESARIIDNRVKITEAGNRQRAFKGGVEHLGSEKSSVRQGGAHILFHLALEDDKLRAPIAGVLCAHIRETTSDKDYQEKNEDKPSTEMQSLVRLLFTTETVDEKRLAGFWRDTTPDLNGGYFCGVELESARFQRAKLKSAQFQGASLGDARFQGASLEGTRFQRASLEGAQFQGASLGKAQFQGASLDGAQFDGASLGKAQFQGASLEGARFHVAWLDGARFQGASLEGARFQGASLRGGRFQGASLEGARFQGASLEGARFQGASLYMAGFQQAKFGQGPGHEGIPDQDRATAKPDELAEQWKASAFHGASSESHVRKSFEGRINDRTGKESNFSKVIFAGGVTEELLAEAKEALERVSWAFGGPGFKEKVIRGLESEAGQPESHAPPKEVIAGSYGKEGAGRWILEYREATEKTPEANQAA